MRGDQASIGAINKVLADIESLPPEEREGLDQVVHSLTAAWEKNALDPETLQRQMDRLQNQLRTKTVQLDKAQQAEQKKQERDQQKNVREELRKNQGMSNQTGYDSVANSGGESMDEMLGNMAGRVATAFANKEARRLRLAIFVKPPKFVPEELYEIWEYAVERAEEEGVEATPEGKPNYPAMIAIYKNALKKYAVEAEKAEKTQQVV